MLFVTTCDIPGIVIAGGDILLLQNLTFTLTQFWFTFQTGFSGQRFYDDWFQSLYNVIFTALPVIIVGLFDKVPHYLYLGLRFWFLREGRELTCI